MADNKISDLPTCTLTTDDLIEVEQPAEAAGTRSRKATLAQAIALALITGQLPVFSGASPSSQPSCVLPFRPECPIWQHSFAYVSAWTKSASRFHATSCSGA